jgi:hypothetical protein
MMNESVSLSLETRLTRSRTHVACEVGDEMVILSLQNGEYYGLNPIASRIWTLLEGPVTIQTIRDILLGEYYDVSPERCVEQVIVLLEEMVELGLVEAEECDRP